MRRLLHLRYLRWGALFASSILVVLLAIAQGDRRSTLERARAQGVLRVGIANERPYAYYDPETNRLTGEAPEVARAVLQELGIAKLEGVLVKFSDLIPGLRAGRFDAIAAGLDITPERCQQIAFSNPTFQISASLLVAAGNPLQLHSYDDLRTRQARVGVGADTIEQTYAEALALPPHRLVIVPDAPKAVEAVKTGRLDAYAASALLVQQWVDRDRSGAIARAEPFAAPNEIALRHYGAFGFRQRDRDLLAAFNTQLAAFLGTPRHRALIRPFGFTARELPGDTTADDLCRPAAAALAPRELSLTQKSAKTRERVVFQGVRKAAIPAKLPVELGFVPQPNLPARNLRRRLLEPAAPAVDH